MSSTTLSPGWASSSTSRDETIAGATTRYVPSSGANASHGEKHVSVQTVSNGARCWSITTRPESIWIQTERGGERGGALGVGTTSSSWANAGADTRLAANAKTKRMRGVTRASQVKERTAAS